jgi:hypothetical protein
VFRRSTPPPSPMTPLLEQIRTELAPTVEEEPRRSVLSWLRAALWVRRRSHGIPAALFAIVWALGAFVRSPIGPSTWVVVLAGWVFVVAVWWRARSAHFVHTMAVAVFIAAWLVWQAL